MKTIGILGSGWLGLPLVKHFLSMGHKVHASIRSENRVKDIECIGACPFIVDIDHLGSDIKLFLKADILIINIPSKNVEGFCNLIEKIKTSKIKNVLFVSSTSVYENANTTIMESDTEYYSKSPLLEIERQFEKCKEFKTTIIRFGGLIGYTRHPGRFFSSGRVVSDPESPVNLIHRDDCIGIIDQIVEQNFFGDVFNCCADTHPTKREFYTKAAELINNAIPKFDDSDSVLFKIISNQKVKQLLNYKFKHPDLMKINIQESCHG